MVWGAVAAVAGGAVLQGLGNEKSARAVRRNARRQRRYLEDYSKKKMNRSKAFAQSLSHIGDDYIDQVTRYYDARNSQDRSDAGRAAYEAQTAGSLEEASQLLGDIGLDQTDEQKKHTEGLHDTDVSPYMEALGVEAEMLGKGEFGSEKGMDLFRAGKQIESESRGLREDFQYTEAEHGLEHEKRMQEFELAGQKAQSAGDDLAAVGSILQAGGMVGAMF